jgi:hypothetical protein
MTFLLLNLLQPQRRISLAVIIGAVVAFIAGVSLLVYFYRRYKGIEKESEEDWDSSRRSLFVNIPPPASAAKIEESDISTSVELKAPVAQELPVQASGTRELASNIDLASFAPTTAEPEPKVEAAALEKQPEAAPPPPEPRPTEMLASPSLAGAAAEEPEAAPFDAEVWADLEIAEQPPLAAEQEVVSQSPPEPLSVARVEQPSQREPFETPRIERSG